MRVAALYDIHGNLPALEAALEAAVGAGADRIVVGGDVVPGPMPTECLAFLLEVALPVSAIRGNGEAAVLTRRAGADPGVPEVARASIDWTADRLDPGEARLIASWPATLTLDHPELGRILFCHATPESDTEIFTRRTPERRLLPLFRDLDADLVVCGHTHMPFDRTIGGIRVVNAGSVGMPFGPPGAAWLLLGSGVELRRTGYDLEEAAARLRATSYPDASGFAERHVLDRPSEEAMLEAFEPAGP